MPRLTVIEGHEGQRRQLQERLAALEIRPMELQDFRAKLRALQNGEQAE